MLPLEKKINLSTEIERLISLPFKILIPNSVILELQKLVQNPQNSVRLKAKLALELASSFDTLEEKGLDYADNEILMFVKKTPTTIVATTDRELRKKLKELNIPTITLRGKNRLILLGDL